MKDSILDRIKITKKNKLKRKSPGLGHCRSNKETKTKLRRKKLRNIKIRRKKLYQIAL